MKNLVYIAEVLKDVQEMEGEVKVSLIWLVRKLRQRINMELARAPLNTTIVSPFISKVLLVLVINSSL